MRTCENHDFARVIIVSCDNTIPNYVNARLPFNRKK